MLDLLGSIFIVMFGALCYFISQKTEKIKILHLFCGAEKEIDNYIRLLIGPFIAWSLIEMFFIGEEPNFMVAKLLGLGAGLIVIPSFCYSYRTIAKKGYKGLDIAIYLISVVCAQMFSFQIIDSAPVPATVNYASLVILLILFMAYLLHILTPMGDIIEAYDKPIKKKIQRKQTK